MKHISRIMYHPHMSIPTPSTQVCHFVFDLKRSVYPCPPQIDWVDWASVVRYNVIPLAIYNPVGAGTEIPDGIFPA